VEVTESQFDRLNARVWPWDPASVGWRGPIVDDTDSWSFWSSPLRDSGQRPRVPKGRYLQVQVELETGTLGEFARVDSLVIETSSLLAERVLGEVAVAGDLQPQGKVALVEAGTPVEFVYDLRAEFARSEQPGFDAVRVLLPSPGVVRGLEMGEPLINVIGPKSTIVHFQTVQSITAELNGTDIAVVYRLAGGRRETCRLRMPDSEACHLYTSSRLNCETLRGFGTRFAPAGLSEIGLPIMQGANQCATESPWNFKELIWETSV
jgi:hypothetical protein